VTAATPRRRARRGDGALLRGELLVAAKGLLAETGDEAAVTVRAVAQRVGVSVPSVYLHFADKQELIDAVCDDVFEEIGVAMDAAAVGATDPLDALRRRGIAYCDFGLAHPEQYRVLFMQRPDSPVTYTVADMLQAPAFGNLVGAVQECLDAGVFAQGEPFQLALGLWASAHGVVSLVIAKPGFPWPPTEALFSWVVEMAGCGTAVLSQAGTPARGRRAGRTRRA
jgi:AcrR family transcriptional regulator